MVIMINYFRIYKLNLSINQYYFYTFYQGSKRFLLSNLLDPFLFIIVNINLNYHKHLIKIYKIFYTISLLNFHLNILKEYFFIEKQ